MVFLQGHGVSSTFAAKIFKKYGKESIEKVSDNPYCLADDIWGIGFKTADSIAKNLGYTNNDPHRCQSGILYTLGKLSEEGHVYAEREQLLMTHFVMLQRNLVYTGITRAKKICFIIGTTKALAYSIHNMVVQKRNTKLKERLSLRIMV